jgi:Flp pilus assembly protein TadD
MGIKRVMIVAILAATVVIGGCASSQTPKDQLLPAPSGSNPIAARHNDEGIQAYRQKLDDSAKRHFEAAVQADPEMAEAHYNLGMVLWELGVMAEARPHLIKAANLASGNKVIWNSPALSGVEIPEREIKIPGSSDGHMHSH